MEQVTDYQTLLPATELSFNNNKADNDKSMYMFNEGKQVFIC